MLKKHELAFVDYVNGMKYKDIAAKYEVSLSTTKSWSQRYNWSKKGMRTKRGVHTKTSSKSPVSKKAIEKLNNSGLTDEQQLFCIYMIKYFNATKAYQKIKQCDYAVAAVMGHRWLKIPEVKKEIKNLKKARFNKALLEPEDIFQKYMDIAFSDLTDYLSWGREEVPVMAMYGPVEVEDPITGEKVQLMKEINCIKFKESDEIDGTILQEVKQGKEGPSIKLADRMKALDWLANHMNMATDFQKAQMEVMRIKVTGDEQEEIEDDGFMDALNGTAQEDWQDED